MSVITRVISGFVHAVRGLIFVLKFEKNARIHLFSAMVVAITAILLRMPVDHFAALMLGVLLVFLAEVINTAIEKTLDLLHPEQNEVVRIVKDISAGAVLIAALGAFSIGVLVAANYLGWI